VNGSKTIRYGNGQLSECFDAIELLLGRAQERGQGRVLGDLSLSLAPARIDL
jgi:hypothetical protein